jgi:biopolymer transport protein ExbB
MRDRFSIGWLASGLLGFWLLTAVGALLSGGVLFEGRPALAGEGDVLLDDELGPAEPAGAAQPSDTGPQKKPVLKWMYESLGILYSVVFLSLSFTLVALFVMNLLTARRENVVPVALVEGFEAHLNEKRYQ